MLEALVTRQVRQYQVAEYEKGQRATDYTTWLTSTAHYNAKFEEVSLHPGYSLTTLVRRNHTGHCCKQHVGLHGVVTLGALAISWSGWLQV